MTKKEITPGSSPMPPSRSLYLARSIHGDSFRYSLRQSCPAEGENFLRHREIFDLGHDPARFLVYPSGNTFHVRDDLVEAIAGLVEGEAADLLEEILWPFVRKDIREKVAPFRERARSRALTKVTAAEQEAIDRELHLFDRRRLHYLWYGAIDQSGLYRMPAKLCRKLLGKSRDEKEQYFISREMVLYADQVKEYLFTVFNLQHYFTESYARILPQALNQERLDAFFLDELCSLNEDRIFWQGMEPAAGLQPYLVRYLILFFDYDFNEADALNDYIRQFMDSHRQFRFPQRKSTMSMEEASGIFDESAEHLAKLSKRELTKLFRKKAKELHPDTGGDHEKFVRLKEAFEELRRKR
ncbi:MAG: J domain-containing protein [Deltaproteobacteria bacterium]|nr:J domain-containing protein [Deltaproteobacteria bacterium]